MKETTVRFWYDDKVKGETYMDIDLKDVDFKVDLSIDIHKQADYLINRLSFHVGIESVESLGAICYLSDANAL